MQILLMSSIQTASALRPKRIDVILNQLDQLPTLPSVAVRVLQATTSEDTSAHDVVEIISSDQSLCTKILSLAAKASLGAPRGVETIDKAVVLLGFDAVRHAVLSIKVFETFASVEGAPTGHFDRNAFWKHSLAVGCASHLIAERWPGHVDPEVAFVCGLLHDIGKMALDACLPKSYDRVAGVASSRHVSIIDVEQEILGVDHTVAGQRLAQRWKLPASVTACIWLHHHTPDMLPDGVSNPDLVQIVNLSDTWVREQHLGFSGALPEGPSSVEIANQMCLPIEHLSSIAPLLLERVEERAEMIGLDTLTSGEMYAQAVANVNAELGRLNGKLASCNQQMEARARTLDLIHRFHTEVHNHSSLNDICQVAATCFRELADVAKVGIFARRRGSDVYYLGLADGRESAAEVFACENGNDDDPSNLAMANQSALLVAPPLATPVLERFGDRLGPPPHWMLPLAKDGEGWGGILFHANTAEVERLRQCPNELTLFAAALANVLVSGYDRLDLERLNEGLAHVNRQLKAAQRVLCRTRSLEMVAEMAAGAAHELNNPLAVISGRAELLARQTADERTKNGLEIIVSQAHRCSGIVNELMEFAKPDAPQKQRLQLSALLEQVAGEWVEKSSLLPERLKVEISDPDICIDADPDQVKNMFAELLKNAGQACEPPKARLKINCAADVTDEVAVVTIEDNGCGMDAEVLEKARDPFFSHKVSGRRRGLGLSRAVRWCEINGGTMRIESSPDQGTRVWVKFPISTHRQH